MSNVLQKIIMAAIRTVLLLQGLVISASPKILSNSLNPVLGRPSSLIDVNYDSGVNAMPLQQTSTRQQEQDQENSNSLKIQLDLNMNLNNCECNCCPDEKKNSRGDFCKSCNCNCKLPMKKPLTQKICSKIENCSAAIGYRGLPGIPGKDGKCEVCKVAPGLKGKSGKIGEKGGKGPLGTAGKEGVCRNPSCLVKQADLDKLKKMISQEIASQSSEESCSKCRSQKKSLELELVELEIANTNKAPSKTPTAPQRNVLTTQTSDTSPEPLILREDYIDDEREWTQDEIDAYYTYIDDEAYEGDEVEYGEGWHK